MIIGKIFKQSAQRSQEGERKRLPEIKMKAAFQQLSFL
jgi:hypothetical protein